MCDTLQWEEIITGQWTLSKAFPLPALLRIIFLTLVIDDYFR